MRRNLHIKLVLIMVLLIVSLMVVVGAFLMNSVTGYYINDFTSRSPTLSARTTPTSSETSRPPPRTRRTARPWYRRCCPLTPASWG